MPHPMAGRVSSFGTSIFTEMSALALEHNAINLSQGFPDFAAPQIVKQAAIDAIRDEHNQYAPAPGVPRLRKAIADTYERDYGLVCDPQQDVTVTSGATEALCSAILATVDPGDEVIVFEPAYDAYVPDIVMAGGVPRFVTLHPPASIAGGTGHPDQGRWHFDPDALQAAFNNRTRAIIINTPHNPTGKVFTRPELELVADLCREHDVLAITDEVYDRLVFDGRHLPLATLPGMWERTITINSTGKTFSATGWKIGYAIASLALTDALRRAHQFVTFATATPFQVAMAQALEQALAIGYFDDLHAFYDERRVLLVELLRSAGMDVVSPEGTYFVMAGIQGWGFERDVDFCRYLTTEVGVAAIPPSVFYSEPARAPLMARFCFAKELATLHAAAERLKTRVAGGNIRSIR
jgi:aspartate/methionine/tyrosine aminotransferase